eukprot:jgi/Astpho2/2575/Aster-x0106
MYAGNYASGKDPCDHTPASILQVNMAEVETKISFVLKLMLSMFGVPKAAACFADNQVWQQTAKGLEEADGAAWRPFTSAVMQCETDELLSVDDTQQDHRFRMCSLVTARPSMRFYAGMALMTQEGEPLGALCVVDWAPRTLTSDNASLLRNFADMLSRDVERQFEAHRGARQMFEKPRRQTFEEQRKSIELTQVIMDGVSDAVALLDVTKPGWPMLFANEGWRQVTGSSRMSTSGKGFWDIFRVPGCSSDRLWLQYMNHIERKQEFTAEVVRSHSSGKKLHHITFRLASQQAAADGMGRPQDIDGLLGGNLWFGIIKPSQSMTPTGIYPVPQPAAMRNATDASVEASSTGTHVGGETQRTTPFEDVKLGQLLGKGSFGAVYSGVWNGAQVAVKSIPAAEFYIALQMIEHLSTEEAQRASNEALEAILGLKMMHPNIVRTFKFTTCERAANLAELNRLSADGSLTTFQEDSASADGGLTPDLCTASGRKLAPTVMETWILLVGL